MTHLAVLAAFTLRGCTLGWCASRIVGPHHEGDRPARPGTNRSSLREDPGSGHLTSLGGVGGPTPPAPTPARSGRPRAPRGWNLTPTHPAAPRPSLYDWRTAPGCEDLR